MAKAEILFKVIRKWEGGWSDHKNDKGGKTNMGITLSTWKSCGYDKDGDGDMAVFLTVWLVVRNATLHHPKCHTSTK